MVVINLIMTDGKACCCYGFRSKQDQFVHIPNPKTTYKLIKTDAGNTRGTNVLAQPAFALPRCENIQNIYRSIYCIAYEVLSVILLCKKCLARPYIVSLFYMKIVKCQR